LQFCSFIFQVASARRESEVTFFWFSSQSATCCYLSNHSKVESFRQAPCPRTQKANFPACSPHYPFMQNVKQGNCEY